MTKVTPQIKETINLARSRGLRLREISHLVGLSIATLHCHITKKSNALFWKVSRISNERCKECGKPLLKNRGKIFCNWECRNKNNKKRIEKNKARAKELRRGGWEIKKIANELKLHPQTVAMLLDWQDNLAYRQKKNTLVCEWCGKNFLKKSNQEYSARYCSKKCRKLGQSKKASGRKKEVLAPDGNGYILLRGFPDHAKKYEHRAIAERIGWLGGCLEDDSGLCIAHKDGNRANNSPFNLMVVKRGQWLDKIVGDVLE